MPEFYAEHNLRRHFTAPQFTRSRHRFRGARESEKVNLEMDQLYYSIHKLYQMQDQFQDRFIQKANILLEGGATTLRGEVPEYPDPESYPEGELYPISDNPIELSGIEDIAARINGLRQRVRSLENS